jgi:ClpP class serine protease
MSQARHVMASETATIGNVGVYIPIRDDSMALAEQRVKIELIKAGKYKAMGFPGSSMTLEQRNFLQGQVNSINAAFHSAVLAKREIKEEDLEGQAFSGGEAFARGFVDEIGTLRNAKYTTMWLGKNSTGAMA